MTFLEVAFRNTDYIFHKGGVNMSERDALFHLHRRGGSTNKMTVLFREGGSWDREEISRLTNNLNVQVTGMDAKPEYLVLEPGHFTKDKVLDAFWGGLAFTVTYISGTDDPAYPF